MAAAKDRGGASKKRTARQKQAHKNVSTGSLVERGKADQPDHPLRSPDTRELDRAMQKHTEKRLRGRPSTYTPEVGAEICVRLAEGETLTDICRDDHMPPRGTVTRWLVTDLHPDFSLAYARARHIQLEGFRDEILDIADDTRSDFIIDPETNEPRYVKEMTSRSRLRIDTRKFLLSKLMPETYGDSLKVSGPNGGPLQVQHQVTLDPRQLSDEALRQVIAARAQAEAERAKAQQRSDEDQAA